MNGVAPSEDLGRTDHFMNGATSTVPQAGNPSIAPTPFTPTSVLDQTSQSGAGFSEADHQRQLMGMPSSPNGQSTDTAQHSTQLRYPFMRF